MHGVVLVVQGLNGWLLRLWLPLVLLVSPAAVRSQIDGASVEAAQAGVLTICLLYTSPSPRDPH